MTKEARKQLEKEVLEIAHEVLEAEDHILYAAFHEEVSQEKRNAGEEILLKKYNIKSLKFDGYENLRVYTLASYDESELEAIIEKVKPKLPEMDEERQLVEKVEKERKDFIKSAIDFIFEAMFGDAVCAECCSGGFEKEPDEEDGAEEDMTAN